jgi:hypothetical protein
MQPSLVTHGTKEAGLAKPAYALSQDHPALPPPLNEELRLASSSGLLFTTFSTSSLVPIGEHSGDELRSPPSWVISMYKVPRGKSQCSTTPRARLAQASILCQTGLLSSDQPGFTVLKLSFAARKQPEPTIRNPRALAPLAMPPVHTPRPTVRNPRHFVPIHTPRVMARQPQHMPPRPGQAPPSPRHTAPKPRDPRHCHPLRSCSGRIHTTPA